MDGKLDHVVQEDTDYFLILKVVIQSKDSNTYFSIQDARLQLLGSCLQLYILLKTSNNLRVSRVL